MKGRTYRFMDDALFPFGFGLSYTSFEIGAAQFNKTSIKPNETIQLTLPVKNTGKRAGTEIVQVYVRKVNDLEGPLKTLRGFKRVSLQPAASQTVTLELNASAFEFFDWAQRKMAVTPGTYEVFYGNSSAAASLKSTLITIL